ncbi:hypothetical protein ECP26DNA_00005 [Escherichia phage vB_EcoM-ECP26]|jgi:hypothetical protein|uniref:Profilin n=1 Tax=Escherichia phage vB_EcoM-ECP26 TaxID=2576873 RepID=A0A4Y5TVM1_9CAUD|nr:hypothetical protein ECP26DNA_00005 [Escherichia phage vB_EcoM-ECP26]
MKNIWDINIFEASELDGADGVIIVSDGKVTLTSGLTYEDTTYALGDLALLKSTGDSLEERLQGFAFKEGTSTTLMCTTRTVQLGNGVYMVIAVCPKFSNINKDDADAVNDVVVLFVGDAMADLMNAGEAANED